MQAMAEGREAQQDKTMKRILLIINCTILAIGATGAPLMLRLYFTHGGHRIWLSGFLQVGGFPIMLLPLSISYIRRRRAAAAQTTKTKMVLMELPLFLCFAVIGLIIGANTVFYAYGSSRLPVSTSSLILASQLAFNAVFSFLVVKQKFRAYSINAVVLLTLAAVVLSLRSNADRSAGETKKQYVMGFVFAVMVAVLDGLSFPLMELAYKRSKQTVTYSLVLEVQFVTSAFATLFTIAGMIIKNDFKLISGEANQFESGEAAYYAVLVGTAMLFQAFLLGIVGVIFCASSLLSGVLIAVFLPMTEVLAIIFFKEKFHAEKGVALFLSLWGFISYFYGEIKQGKKMKKNLTAKSEIPLALPNPSP